MNKNVLKLIYFAGCPNAKLLADRLTSAAIIYENICQNELPEDSPYRKYASPTLLKGDSIVFGSATGEKGGCSLDLPDASEIKGRIRRITELNKK